MISLWFTGFGIGILGSIHCVGMCGPLVLALPFRSESNQNPISSIILYQIGRISAYILLGFLIGLIGMGFFIFRLEQLLSIISGIGLILFALNRFHFLHNSWLNKIYSGITVFLKKWITGKPSLFQWILLGASNGFLPCGLVTMALMISLSTGNYLKSASVMFGFGLGTIPALLFILFLPSFFNNKFRVIHHRIIPVFTICVAVLLILRGLNLGIPFISPLLNGSDMVCCHK